MSSASRYLMKRSPVIPCVLVLLSLGGCGQVANIRSLSNGYVPPKVGETARLRVVTDGIVRAVPGRDCIDWNVPGAGVMVSTRSGFPDHNGESLGMPGPTYTWAGTEKSELLVTTNKPITFHYLGQLQYSRHCSTTMTFVPRPGTDYLVQATMYAQCSIQLDELSADGLQWDLVKSTPEGKVSMCNVMDNF